MFCNGIGAWQTRHMPKGQPASTLTLKGSSRRCIPKSAKNLISGRHGVSHSRFSRLGSVAGDPASVGEDRRVLVLPGYFIDSKQMLPLVESLRQRGFSAMLPPLRWHDWIPTVGGRPLRPVLDLIDYALAEAAGGVEVGEETGYEVPLPQESDWKDWLRRFRDPSKGHVPPLLSGEEKPQKHKVAVVASSAMGWITRILLGDGPEYWGRTYHGHEKVDALVTLGTPHFCGDRGISKANMDFVNNNYPGAYFNSVRYACIAGKSKKGERGMLPDFTYQSYQLLVNNGEVWGDGVTPVDCALGLEGAESLVLEDVWHLPLDAKEGRVWYGSDGIVDEWVKFLQ